MVRFQIPSPFLAGFEIIRSLQQEEVQQLTQYLEQIQVGTGPQTFEKHFREAFKAYPRFNRDFSGTIYSLGSFRVVQKLNMPDEELAESIANSYLTERNLDVSDIKADSLYKNLLDLLQASQRLQTTFKAFSLITERESIYRDARIITDIRPIFNEKIEDRNRHAMVTHQLKITAEENDERLDYFFSLTLAELEKLKDQILRAEEKEKVLQDNYKDQISFINITE